MNVPRSFKYAASAATFSVAAVVFVLAADPPATQPADPGSPQALVGKPAPAFKLTSLDGQPHALSDAKGHVVVLDFWGTWCVPCHLALPHVDSLYQQQSPHGLMVFAIDNGDEKSQAAKYITDTKLTLPVLLDPDSTASAAYKVDEFPQTVVIGKDGLVKNVFIGFKESTSPADLEKAVTTALAAPDKP